MAFSYGDVVTVMTLSGEFVGKLVSNDGDTVMLDDPRYVTATEQGMGFAGGIAMTGVKEPKQVTLYNIAFVTQTNEEVISAYRTTVSGLITPQAGKILI